MMIDACVYAITALDARRPMIVATRKTELPPVVLPAGGKVIDHRLFGVGPDGTPAWQPPAWA